MTLQALFDKDPALISDTEIDQIVNSMREARRLWALEESSAKTQGRKPNPHAAKLPPIDLDELEIKI